MEKMQETTAQLEKAIERGLKYLEDLFESKPWAFSSTLYTVDRKTFTEDYESVYVGLPEHFTHFFALSLLGNHVSPNVRSKLAQSLLPVKPQILNYFVAPSPYPNEVDTTSMGYSALLKANMVTQENLLSVAEKVFSNVGEDGIVNLHLNPTEERRKNTVCGGICANVLQFAYAMRQESKLQNTENYIFKLIESGKWKKGTMYYPSGFTLLFLCSNFLKLNFKVQKRFRPVMLSAIENSIEDCRFPMDYALVLLVLANLGERDLSKNHSKQLLQMQEEDGSWPADAIWCDRHGVLWGGKALSTIFSVAALVSDIGVL